MPSANQRKSNLKQDRSKARQPSDSAPRARRTTKNSNRSSILQSKYRRLLNEIADILMEARSKNQKIADMLAAVPSLQKRAQMIARYYSEKGELPPWASFRNMSEFDYLDPSVWEGLYLSEFFSIVDRDLDNGAKCAKREIDKLIISIAQEEKLYGEKVADVQQILVEHIGRNVSLCRDRKKERELGITRLADGHQHGSAGKECGTGWRGTARLTEIEKFLQRCMQETGAKLTKSHIWKVVGHKRPRQFQYWQANDNKATKQDDINFKRILAMKPADFIKALEDMDLIPKSTA